MSNSKGDGGVSFINVLKVVFCSETRAGVQQVRGLTDRRLGVLLAPGRIL